MARLFFVLLLLLSSFSYSQSSNKFYAGFGWHRIFFTRSTIHFRDNKTGNYDFRLYKVKAEDDHDLRVGKGREAPQFTILAGYYFNKKEGIELHYDHAKYIMLQDQTVRIRGQIENVPMDKDTTLSRNFLQYEHTHGANHFMINYVRTSAMGNGTFVMKPGAGIAIPHSDNQIFGKSGKGKYHLAGFVIAVDIGWRYPVLKHAFVQLSLKTAYALYKDVLLYGEGRASQHWFSLQPILVVGYQ
jgi:hypothetical protein